MAINAGQKKPHRERKNGAAREQWQKSKLERNKRKTIVHLDRPWPLNGLKGYEPS